jgi:hypothetical protein
MIITYSEREWIKSNDPGGMGHALALYARSLEACDHPDRHPSFHRYMCGLLCDAHLSAAFAPIARLFQPQPLPGLTPGYSYWTTA